MDGKELGVSESCSAAVAVWDLRVALPDDLRVGRACFDFVWYSTACSRIRYPLEVMSVAGRSLQRY